jgi:hypothetical protein
VTNTVRTQSWSLFKEHCVLKRQSVIHTQNFRNKQTMKVLYKSLPQKNRWLKGGQEGPGVRQPWGICLSLESLGKLSGIDSLH